MQRKILSVFLIFLTAIIILFALNRCSKDKVTYKFFTVTAYCPCAKCCGKPNKPTACGKMPVEGVTCAMSRSIPFGTKVMIESVGVRTCQDRLAKRFDNRIDIFFKKHSDALKFGKRRLRVSVADN